MWSGDGADGLQPLSVSPDAHLMATLLINRHCLGWIVVKIITLEKWRPRSLVRNGSLMMLSRPDLAALCFALP